MNQTYTEALTIINKDKNKNIRWTLSHVEVHRYLCQHMNVTVTENFHFQMS